MKRYTIKLTPLLGFVAAATLATSGAYASKQDPGQGKGLAVSYPWEYQGGDKTSRETARKTVEEILSRAGYVAIPHDVARSTWEGSGFPHRSFRDRPSDQALEAFGQKTHATEVLFGSVSWHTRSVWVDLGPKTISTATVNVYVFDVASGKVVYKEEQMAGRSDETENGWKVAADVLVTPLVTAVSGGPATPREQRAVQIALGKAFHPWVRGNRTTH